MCYCHDNNSITCNGSSMMSTCNCSSMVSRIYVEGYDTSLSGYAFVEAMREHLASCGEVIHVHIPGQDTVFALVYLRGEGAEEKALKLSGSDMGGHKVVATPYPFQATDLDPVLSLTRDSDNRRQLTMGVTGYDISLPVDHVERMLFEHFSQCGCVLSARAHADESEGVLSSATVTFQGQATVEKALQLCGCAVEGLGNIQVTRVAPPEKNMLPIMTPPWMWTSRRTDGSFMLPRPNMYMNLILDPVFLVTKENLSPRKSRRTDGSFTFTPHPPPRMPNNGEEKMTAREKKEAAVAKVLLLLE
ncbi:unnamed protein product [Thlaspi arvense]|uniref:RRM domain-containing protein n=1 Tax=Thlaspi arvense TaxID=13288 RepID=A0AAU9T1M1_THLAR|nr:unnamed protein product [Thlaspi arvense]